MEALNRVRDAKLRANRLLIGLRHTKIGTGLQQFDVSWLENNKAKQFIMHLLIHSQEERRKAGGIIIITLCTPHPSWTLGLIA